MTKVAIMCADGCEEVEALTPVDVFRRLGIQADMVGLSSTSVSGAHDIQLTADKVLDDSLLDYDAVIFPGGMGGAKNLRNCQPLEKLMVKRQQAGKWNCAMCAAPTAFAHYGLLDNADYTVYPGMEEAVAEEAKDSRFHEDITVVDHEHHLVTSRGPATAMAYAFQIAAVLGIDTQDLQHAMLYDFLKENI
ncbi:DJ-1 family glyoxalase III [uncultured Limosilactobacillus sp.]|uniref:DJ-1 family glyoxalase III n=1 Tax=uncultured Limosilactobacillus sp. TaxID=2837629 RepID=UPI0025F15983|nr:DJ-1 family glyoxalase III [uncultured Limosilactobacillus sp.]